MITGGKQKRVGQLAKECANCAGIELEKTKYGSACKPVPGYDVQVLKSDGKQAKPNEMGDVVVKLPLPPGTFPTLWGADERYKETYMSNYPWLLSNL